MAWLPFRRPSGPTSKTLRPKERGALYGSEGTPAAINRFVTESDVSRQIDAILTDGTEPLVGSDGSILYG